MSNTIRLHRVLRATPERIYRAFLDPDAMAKWLPPHGFTEKVHQMDARVGGTYKMSFTNFTSQKSHSFGGEYLELVHPHAELTPIPPSGFRMSLALRQAQGEPERRRRLGRNGRRRLRPHSPRLRVPLPRNSAACASV